METWVVVDEERLRGREAREGRLRQVEATGFESDTQLNQIRERIIDVGLPVDNIVRLKHERNKIGKEEVLASWGVGNRNRGEFTVFDLLDRQIPEKQVGTIVHELAHGSSPMVAENDRVFGSRQERLVAADLAVNIADQTIQTQVFLNGYHAYLYKRYVAGTLPGGLETFIEETWAISLEMAMTNRKGLLQKQESQRQVAEELQKAKMWKGEVVQIITDPGSEEAAGVDKALLGLVDGVSDMKDLRTHLAELKRKHYSEENQAKLLQRSGGIIS